LVSVLGLRRYDLSENITKGIFEVIVTQVKNLNAGIVPEAICESAERFSVKFYQINFESLQQAVGSLKAFVQCLPPKVADPDVHKMKVAEIGAAVVLAEELGLQLHILSNSIH